MLKHCCSFCGEFSETPSWCAKCGCRARNLNYHAIGTHNVTLFIRFSGNTEYKKVFSCNGLHFLQRTWRCIYDGYLEQKLFFEETDENSKLYTVWDASKELYDHAFSLHNVMGVRSNKMDILISQWVDSFDETSGNNVYSVKPLSQGTMDLSELTKCEREIFIKWFASTEPDAGIDGSMSYVLPNNVQLLKPAVDVPHSPTLMLVDICDSTKQYKAKLSQNIVVGKSEDVDLVIPDFLISREHCLFSYIDDTLYITDLNSKNGTSVNGVSISQRKFRVKPGSKIMLGHREFSLELRG